MYEYDDEVIRCFLDNQLKLFPEAVAETPEEAEEFLEDCMAVVLNSAKEVMEYFEEEGVDLEERDVEDVLELEEVFKISDGRYLIVEGQLLNNKLYLEEYNESNSLGYEMTHGNVLFFFIKMSPLSKY